MGWANTREDRQRSGRTYDHRWRRARKAQLERSPNCEIRLAGCTTRATEVDHITGAANDPEHRHLRSACTTCHRKVTASQGGGFRRNARPADPAPQPSTAW